MNTGGSNAMSRIMAHCNLTPAQEVASVCPSCQSGALRFPFVEKLSWLACCVECGLRYASPQPSDEELSEIYNEEYYSGFGFTSESPASYREMKQIGFTRLLALAETFVSPGSLVDIGSALGDMLLAASRRGWKAAGIERNSYAVARANELIPNATFHGSLEDFNYPAATADLVTCVDVIEHLRQPTCAFRRVIELLRPGGCLLLTTVDVDGWQSRVCGHRWVHYHRDHLWYFNRQSLQGLAHQAGFEVIICRTARKTFKLRYILEIFATQKHSGIMSVVAERTLRWIPACLGSYVLPAMPEGLLLLARKPI